MTNDRINESPPTGPHDYMPAWYVERQAEHAASEIHDELSDGVEFMGRLLIFSALVAAVVGVLVIVS